MQKLKSLYIEQLKKSIMDTLNQNVADSLINPDSTEEQSQPEWFNHFWFGNALTMCSLKRLNNVQFCLENCLQENIPGDFIECGVWRGGVAILMRGILAAHGVTDRRVWAADSFQGLPSPPQDSIDQKMYNFEKVIEANRFAVSLETVKSNFARYDLLDDGVQFLPGWFHETLPKVQIDKLAVLRLDGDYYESTMDTLIHLYPKLSIGGYIIIDDWGLDQICGEKQAVIEYRQNHRITDQIIDIDYHSAYWQKTTF
ncbi:TPA: macrocin O-methyltransferase [Candidatus Poribacteria bacterium]|nr:macrocin O-methyltransferase [Candidatus Poribacteria bacterium]HIA68513.1 macrocin O-methyltransferase [Candidatus Poribacteria bacterium]HIB90059.1 macrocin O-methyltransferase [Candidatus Poribacteria bacterium]HIB98107.1 macrocin O-methyltransferase [Candidatus Poribacteria bacterium]HIN27905.1 macrocin O-methyltransferase [Candidatus Poribacteria bacterium]